ncbi:dethiobiotin synthase [Nitrosomonas sp. HPC101]|uniref:dethiobiotin synthase n=1 Tax=Nitrosomonas sp. HPC101 TaxID=1658667 RepID=UPI00136EC003|nr:dethiobiotin synthase [Nitrosomonas sp. HPC101]MXS84714.1 dethiobiotin synthase [Nitrosomonas sp. HPC101]
MPVGFFVTGTDTGIGKTTVSCALLHAFAAEGHTVVGMKPVAAGCENGIWPDVEHLQAASNIRMPQALINPYAFEEPIAPHIAAQQTGVDINPQTIQQACQNLMAVADVTIVEGVGGFKVPLSASDTVTRRYDTGDLASLLGLPVILVAGIRLGWLNHTLLTVQAIQSGGLTLAGWVANTMDPAILQLEANIQTLAEWLDCPPLGVLPYQAQPDAQQLARRIDLSRLR